MFRPGEFSRFRSGLDEPANTVLARQTAVQEIQGTKAMYVVDSANKVVLRTISAEKRLGRSFTGRTGLQPGECVINETARVERRHPRG